MIKITEIINKRLKQLYVQKQYISTDKARKGQINR